MIQKLEGLKTYALVVFLIGLCCYFMCAGRMPIEAGFVLIVTSLLPLTMNARVTRERKRIEKKIEEIKIGNK